ncbi:MAG: diacylglycerol kinase family lipid kinase, partial [Mucinivorans sp.]
FGIARTYPDAVHSIVQGHTFLQDVGRVNYHECRVPQVRYLANVAGVAYDAAVCAGFNKLHQRGYRGKWLYVWSAFCEAIRYRSKPAVVEVDGVKVFEGRLFTATIGVCKYTGGGLSQTPLAVADDGLFDLTIIPQMNRVLMFARHWHTLFDGRIYEIPRVTLHRGARIIIKSQPPIRLELDGEILGESGIDFLNIEKAIRVIVSEKFLESL